MRFRQLDANESGDTARRAAVAFGSRLDDAEVHRWERRLAAGEVWGLTDDAGAVLAHVRLQAVDHWFGGRRVPTQHVASVAVPPEHRGRGVARVLMEEAVRSGAREGSGLSLLFPAATPLYRALGYEQAGSLVRYRVDARAVPAMGEPMRPARDSDRAAIRRCHERAVRALNGPAVRPDDRWAELAEASYAYVLDAAAADEVEAFALVDHRREAGDWQYTLVLRDWAAHTHRGLEAVVGFVGRHGTIGKDATFRDTVPDRWSLLLPEQDAERTGGIYWMARSLDPGVAVEARGFPPGLTGATTIRVEDPLLPAAGGPWRLEVADGRGALAPAPTAHPEVRLTARAAGPLFTGFHSPAELSVAGLLTGDTRALDWLTGAFAGPLPVLFDFF